MRIASPLGLAQSILFFSEYTNVAIQNPSPIDKDVTVPLVTGKVSLELFCEAIQEPNMAKISQGKEDMFQSKVGD